MPGSVGFDNFDTVVKVWIAKTINNIEEIARESAVEVGGRIIDRMPVDRSEYADEIVSKGDWNAAIGTTPEDSNTGDETGEVAFAYIAEMAEQWNPLTGVPFVLANHRDYMDRIEFIGWQGTRSQIPPYAPIGLTVVEWTDIVDAAARKHNGTA